VEPKGPNANDYLGNLVAKSLDLGEVVQPRPASLFEPSPLAGMSTVGESLALESMDDEPTTWDAPAPTWSGVEQPVSPPRASAPSRTAEPDQPGPGAFPSAAIQPLNQLTQHPLPPGSTATQQTETRPGPNPTHTRNVPDPGLLVQLRGVNPSLPSMEPAPSADRPEGTPLVTGAKANQASSRDVAESDGRSSLEPAVQQVRVEHVVTRSMPPATPVTQTEAARSEDVLTWESHRQVKVERIIAPSIRPVTPIKETKATPSDDESQPTSKPADPRPEPPLAQDRLAPIGATPEIVPYLEPVAPARTQALAPEAGPTIHVTIGRVEVRATPAPAARKRTRSRPPVMSLDDYLRQRSGGGPT
jgi:hypothetical protein